MAAELPIYLKQLEPLTGALDMLRYLVEGSATGDEVIADLNLTDRSFDKAKRRLVTNGYIAARSDGILELTQKGVNAANELLQYDENAAGDDSGGNGKIQRRVLVAIPRTLVAGQPAQIIIGIEPDSSAKFRRDADIVLRLSAMYATLSLNGDQMMTLGNHALKRTLEITPENYNQIRLKMQVFQLSPDGEDISNCGGLYVDVNVQASGQPGSLVAYSAHLEFDAV